MRGKKTIPPTARLDGSDGGFSIEAEMSTNLVEPGTMIITRSVIVIVLGPVCCVVVLLLCPTDPTDPVRPVPISS